MTDIIFPKLSWIFFATLRLFWSHSNGVIMGAMASQITSLIIDYSSVYSGIDQRKHQSSLSLAFVRGIHWWPLNSTHKRPVTRKMFRIDDVIMNTTNSKSWWIIWMNAIRMKIMIWVGDAWGQFSSHTVDNHTIIVKSADVTSLYNLLSHRNEFNLTIVQLVNNTCIYDSEVSWAHSGVCTEDYIKFYFSDVFSDTWNISEVQ